MGALGRGLFHISCRSRRWPHLGNALKYATAMSVSLFGTFQPQMHSSALWVFCFVYATLYQFTWDVIMDWDLLRWWVLPLRFRGYTEMVYFTPSCSVDTLEGPDLLGLTRQNVSTLCAIHCIRSITEPPNPHLEMLVLQTPSRTDNFVSLTIPTFRTTRLLKSCT